MKKSSPSDVLSMAACDQAKAIREKALSSQELITFYLERIDSINPQINALVQVCHESALAEARQADRLLASGTLLGPWHGVPFTAKDVFDTAGVVTTSGLVERATYVPQTDAVVVARLKAAGAVLLGKTNCPPGGGGATTCNDVYGKTNNPHRLTYTPGGSSGGEAAAIAACLTPMGLGSDSGGSIRLPAHFCGIAGLKPTSGRVPATGAYDHLGGFSDPRTQVGPMARYVRDLGPLLATIAGSDWHDAAVVDMPLFSPRPPTVKRLRIAFYTSDEQARPCNATIAMVQAAARHLADQGAQLTEALPPGLADARMITEVYWTLDDLPGREAAQLLRDWDIFRTTMLRFLQSFDAILCPVDHRAAQLHGTQDSLRFNYTLPYSLTGWPCVVVHAGTNAEDMPIGLQIVARPWHEETAWVIAQQLECAYADPLS